MARRSPKQILATFKLILDETAKFYGKPGNQVRGDEWRFISAGRMGEGTFRGLGTFVTLREYFYPSEARDTKQAEAVACLKRILANVQKQ